MRKKYRQTIWAGSHAICCEWINSSTSGMPTLVFLHEGLGSIRQWRDLPAQLGAILNFNVLTFDRFGHGCSARLAPPYRRPLNYFQAEAETTIPDLLDQFCISDAVLVGHSDGATIAILAASSGDKRIRAVVAEAGHWFVEKRTLSSIKKLLAQWSHSNLRQRLTKYHGGNVEGMFLGWANLWLNPYFATFDIRSKLPNVDCPVLAIQGTDDQYGSLEQLRSLKSITGNLSSHTFSACGHHPHLELRKSYLKNVENFVSTHLQR